MPAGGTYLSRDGGTTRTLVNDTPSPDAHLSQDAHLTGLAVDPHNPQVAYAATADHRLLKSTGAGLNCTAINQGLPGSPMALSLVGCSRSIARNFILLFLYPLMEVGARP